LRDGQSNAAARAGDQCDLSGQRLFYIHLVSLL
jgi:hypothetical protein